MMVVIFGCGMTGKKIYEKIHENKCDILFADNNPLFWGKTFLEQPVIQPNTIPTLSIEKIYIASLTGAFEIRKQLIDMNIPDDKIVRSPEIEVPLLARTIFLEKFGEMIYSRKIQGNVAEAGVYRGEFAKEINRVFSDRMLYLFDTFSGFDERDLQEKDASIKPAGYFNGTNEELVMKKMPHSQQCIIKKGYFPESAKDVNDTFCFVNLDLDLYKPTLEALRFFSSRITRGGGILVHDYFAGSFPNVRNAVDEFMAESSRMNPCSLPIGDGLSIFIVF